MTHIFIVNPNAGNQTFADDLRRKLLDIKGLNYFVFNTRYAGNETEIIKEIQKIFEEEKKAKKEMFLAQKRYLEAKARREAAKKEADDKKDDRRI